MGINFKVSTCAVARALLEECSKAHGGIISLITDYFIVLNAEAKRKYEARQCPLLPWWPKRQNEARHTVVLYLLLLIFL